MLPALVALGEALGGRALLGAAARAVPVLGRVGRMAASSDTLREIGGLLIPRNAAGRVALGPALMESLPDIANVAMASLAAPPGTSAGDRLNIALQAGALNTGLSAAGRTVGALGGRGVALARKHAPGSEEYNSLVSGGMGAGDLVAGLGGNFLPIPALNAAYDNYAKNQAAQLPGGLDAPGGTGSSLASRPQDALIEDELKRRLAQSGGGDGFGLSTSSRPSLDAMAFLGGMDDLDPNRLLASLS